MSFEMILSGIGMVCTLIGALITIVWKVSVLVTMSKSNQSHLSEHLQRIDESLRTITRLVHRHNEDVEVLKNNVVMLKDGYAAIRLGGIKVANG